jgi:Pyridoxamine 5'-phosphate oxidase
VRQEINGNLDDPNIRKLFESKNFVFLPSLMEYGSPHVAPTWVDIENGYILVNTAIGRIKQKNISRNPRVALAIADLKITSPEW